MPSEKDGVMIILSSPSGAGKTTLVKKLSERDNFEISISHTTRQPRPNENQNEDYFFVDELQFKRLIKNEEFLEYAKVFNNFYGTTRTPVINNLDKGKNVLFDIDWQGADQIKTSKIFKWLKNNGISDKEMLKTFNCGVGFCLIIESKNLKKINKFFSKKYRPYVIGKISKGKNKVKLNGSIDWL